VPTPVLVFLAVALLGPAVAAAAAELLHLLVIVLAVLAGVVGAGVVAYVAWRVSRLRCPHSRGPRSSRHGRKSTCTTTGTAWTPRTWPRSSAGSCRKPRARLSRPPYT
jgi:hypothetical protein